MKRPQTNEAFVRHMMTFSDFGALSQIFILDAIAKQADAVAAMTPEAVEHAFGPLPFVSPTAWRGVAIEIKNRFDTRA